MQVQFHGAAGEVTGSMHLVEAAGRRVLLDCGMLQGGRALEARNSDPFPFDPAGLDALVLSHAHIDHIGRVPQLVARGFRGPVFLQAASADLLPIMLEDAASLAESEAERAVLAAEAVAEDAPEAEPDRWTAELPLPEPAPGRASKEPGGSMTCETSGWRRRRQCAPS